MGRLLSKKSDFSGHWAVYFLLLILGSLVYSNTFLSPFHLDDYAAIAENPSIRQMDLRALWAAFNTRFVAGLTFAMNYAMGGLDVRGYHAFNVGVHILSSFLVYHLALLLISATRMTSDAYSKNERPMAFFAALVFLTHPVQTQAITYIWQRCASLAAFFYLASVVFYLRSRVKRSIPAYGISLFCAVLSFFSKETAFSLPFTILMVEFLCFEDRKSRRIRYVAPFFLMVLIMIPLAWIRASGQILELLKPDYLETGEPAGFLDRIRFVDTSRMDPKTYLITQINVIKTYFRLMFFPLGQNLDYDYPLSKDFFEPDVLFSSLLLAVVFSAGLFLAHKKKIQAIGIFWFFTTICVESIVPQMDVIFEHRLYLPMVGFACFLADVVFSTLSGKNVKGARAVALLVILSYSSLAYHRNSVWRSELSLWQDVIQKSPSKARPYFSRGKAYEQIGRTDLALKDYSRSIELDPAYAKAYNNRGLAYSAEGEHGRAIADFGRALELQPDARVYNNRGISYALMENYDQAIADFTKALELRPDLKDVYIHRAMAYQMTGKIGQAMSDYERAEILQRSQKTDL